MPWYLNVLLPCCPRNQALIEAIVTISFISNFDQRICHLTPGLPCIQLRRSENRHDFPSTPHLCETLKQEMQAYPAFEAATSTI